MSKTMSKLFFQDPYPYINNMSRSTLACQYHSGSPILQGPMEEIQCHIAGAACLSDCPPGTVAHSWASGSHYDNKSQNLGETSDSAHTWFRGWEERDPKEKNGD